MPRRLLHILSADLWGGAEAQMAMQLAALDPAESELELLLFNEGKTAESFRSRGLSPRVEPESQGFYALYRAALAAYRSTPPDVIISHGYKEGILGYALARALRVPWCAWFHGVTEGYSGFAAVKTACIEGLHRLLVRYCAARVICVSEDARKRLGFARLDKSRVLYNVYAPQRLQALPELKQSAIVIVGRLVPVKAVDRALKAFQHLQELLAGEQRARLYIIGEGPEATQLQARATELGLAADVHFLGFREDAAEHIAAAELLLITSDSEGVPTVLLEALYHGTPVVSTDVGGIAEVLRRFPEYPYILCDPDAAQLAEAAHELLENRAKERCTAEQREHWRSCFAAHFSPEIAARQQLALLKEL